MHCIVKETSQWGRVLWMTHGETEVAVALDFGIRVVHLSASGCENLFYVQPADCSDGFTAGDWRLYGGHRLWLAPESWDSYYPDNSPISYTVRDDSVLFEQEHDRQLNVYKSLSIAFQEDGSLRVTQRIRNASQEVLEGAAWGVNTLDAGGTAEIMFACSQIGGFQPQRTISLWSDTNLGDPRLKFTKDRLFATHMPAKDYLKIGLYSNPGKAFFRNKGQCFELSFGADPDANYPDQGCNFELFMSEQFMELESLGIKTEILPGESAVHTEYWRVSKCD